MVTGSLFSAGDVGLVPRFGVAILAGVGREGVDANTVGVFPDLGVFGFEVLLFRASVFCAIGDNGFELDFFVDCGVFTLPGVGGFT